MIKTLKKLFRKTPKKTPSKGNFFRASFDASRTTNDNKNHWVNADGLSADDQNNSYQRCKIRNRARYEVQNNSIARGICETKANDCIGTGPKLQLLTPTRELNRATELSFQLWASEVRLAEKARLMRKARLQDGETFAIIFTNPDLRHPVKLDFMPIEAERVTASYLDYNNSTNNIDGIKLNQYGYPVTYRILNNHPGNLTTSSLLDDATEYPASSIIHVFRQDRPGQHRGISEIMPALPLFAQLRRYTLAVLAAAESAADFAGVIQSDAPADDMDPPETYESFELARNLLVTLPAGYKLGQIKAEQPTSSYKEFRDAIINEIARCLNMPFGIAAGNSMEYNYSSGRLDNQSYFKDIRIDQSLEVSLNFDRLLQAFLEEYALINTAILEQEQFIQLGTLPHQWFFDGFEHVDPKKESSAQNIRLKNRSTNYAIEYAKQGRDWEVELQQVAREKELMEELNITGNDIKTG